MASMYRRKIAAGVKAKEPLVLEKSISRHHRRSKFDGLAVTDLNIGRLADENRRLEILAQNLRADIVRLVTGRYTQH
jgi:hypothetical protein